MILLSCVNDPADGLKNGKNTSVPCIIQYFPYDQMAVRGNAAVFSPGSHAAAAADPADMSAVAVIIIGLAASPDKIFKGSDPVSGHGKINMREYPCI